MNDPTTIDPTADIVGPYGTVQHVPMPKTGDLLPVSRAAITCTLGTWLITAPIFHPAWSQYVLSLIRLDEHPDLPPPVLKFPGASHELLLLAVNPAPGEQTPETVRDHCRDGSLPFLQPVNIAEQFTGTDDEMRAVAWLAARGVVNGVLHPETADAPSIVRAHWLAACTKTLAHLRGEDHAC